MTGWIKDSSEINGVAVHYIRTGGNKPPVILLHGLMLNGACWTPLARALEERYDVIMPDARGHGYSSVTNHGYDYDNLATDVEGLIAALDLRAPVLLGHSMGGMTAALVASRKRQQLQGIILAEPTFLPPWRQREVYDSDVADQHRQILTQSREKYLAESLIRHPCRPRELVEQFVQARFQTSLHAFEILKPPNPDYRQLLNAIDVPSLLVVGDEGTIISDEVVTELTGLHADLELRRIVGAGHAVPYDQPILFSAVVQDFLSSVWQ